MKKKLKIYDAELSGGLVFYKNELVLLLKKEHNHWEIPGGKVEAKENARKTLLREIAEEIGVKAKVEKFLGSIDFKIKGKRFLSHVFICRINKKPKLNEPEKFYAVGMFPLEKAKRLKLAPNVKEALRVLSENKWNI